MVLRGVLEEKTNRIVEIIISSVKPVQLMIGKIIGIALIGLTQLMIWVIMLFAILSVCRFAMPDVFNPDIASSIEITEQQEINYANFTANWDQQEEVTEENGFVQALYSMDFSKLILLFAFFFLTGFFLYASLYAAVGGAVDNDTDTQQFIFPLTLPLIFMIVIGTAISENPDGQLAFWCSIIPFTSPIAMMMRIPFSPTMVQNWEILLSCLLMLIGCFISVWAAAKIYRTGILIYGKKVTYKELWKWLRYKE